MTKHEYYLKLGWSLIPVGDNKRPTIAWEKYQTTPPTLEEVDKWVEKGWNLALVCGDLSGILVIDDDRTQHNLKEYDIVSTLAQKSQHGGKHYFFKCANPEYRNVQGHPTHLDIRANGGYVLLNPAPGYEWLVKPTPEIIRNLPEAPAEVLQMLYATKGERVKPAELLHTEQGARDGNLHKLACHLCNKYPESEWEEVVIPLLLGANATYNPSLPEDIVIQKFNQAAKFVKKNPKTSIQDLGQNLPTINPATPYSQMSDTDLDTKENRECLPVGIPKLDSMFDFPSGYYAICGTPGSGKGFLALWLARKFYTNHQKRSVYFSIEMAESLVRDRIKQAWSDLTLEQYKQGFSTEPAKRMMRDNAILVDEFSSLDTTLQTPENLEKSVDVYYSQGYRVFHFDHLHELDGMFDNSTNPFIAEKWASVIKRICLKHRDIWFFAYVQPNGAAENKTFIKKDDVQGSKVLTKKAEFFLSINRMDKEPQIDVVNENRDVVLYLDKTRVTTKNHVGITLYFSPTGNYFASVEAERYELTEAANTTEQIKKFMF